MLFDCSRHRLHYPCTTAGGIKASVKIMVHNGTMQWKTCLCRWQPMITALNIQNFLQQGIFNMPADYFLQTEQTVFTQLKGSEGNGYIVPKAIHFRNQL